MIRLYKQDEPEVLRTNGAAWLDAIQQRLAAGEIPTNTEKGRYRHPDIKAALIVETHGKCAYCEALLLHITFGDVEHISPKSNRVEDTFRWDNLTLACDVCNTYKKNAVGIIDPYDDEPNDHFFFSGPMIFVRPGSAKGTLTRKQLRLNRADLIIHRSKRLETVEGLLTIIETTADPQIRQVLISDLLDNEASDSSEYAACVRNFLEGIPHGPHRLAENEEGH